MATIQIRIDEKQKQKAKKIFEKMGLDMSSAVKLFFQQTTLLEALPFRPITKNGLTLLEEKEVLLASKEAKKGINTVDFDDTKKALVHLKK